MRQVSNSDILKTFLGESVETDSKVVVIMNEEINADLKSALKNARVSKRRKNAQKRAKKNKEILAASVAKRKASKDISLKNAQAFFREYYPTIHSNGVRENWLDVAPTWNGVTFINPLLDNPMTDIDSEISVIRDERVNCTIYYGARKLLELWGADYIGDPTDYLFTLSEEIGMENNTLHDFLRTNGFNKGRCKHSERGLKVLKLREFVGFHKALFKSDGYSPLKEIHNRARSGCGHNSPYTNKFLYEYGLFKERGFFASPQAIDKILWKVTDAFKRITGRRVSFELALDAMEYSLVPRKAVIIMLVNRAGIITSSYKEARDSLVELMPKLKELNLTLGDLLNRQWWMEDAYWKSSLNLESGSIEKLAIQKATNGKVGDFIGSYNDAIYWVKRLTHDKKCILPKWLRDIEYQHPSLRGLTNNSKTVLRWLKSKKVMVDGVPTNILRTFNRQGIKIQKAEWVKTDYIVNGFLFTYNDGFTYHNSSNDFKWASELAHNAHLQWLTNKPVSNLLKEFEEVSKLACPLLTLETSLNAGNCESGTLAWLSQRGLPTEGIIGLQKLIHLLEDDDRRFKMVVMEALRRTRIELGI